MVSELLYYLVLILNYYLLQWESYVGYILLPH